MTVPDTSAEVWLIVKRGYYYRPDSCGYTAIKSEAGRYSLEETSVRFPNESDSGLSFIHENDADDYSPACDPMTKMQHENKSLRQQLAEAQSAAMRFVRVNDEYDEGKPRIMREYAASRAAILALKTTKGDSEDGKG